MAEMLTEEFRNKWKNIVEEEYAGLPPVKDPTIKNAIYSAIHNTEKDLQEATVTGDIAQYTPVLISLIRRTLPTLVGPELVGLQPMSVPTGRIFVQHVYGGGSEIWKEGAVGTSTAAGAAPNASLSGPYTTANGEQLGVKGTADAKDPAGTGTVNTLTPGVPWPEMQFSISAVDVSVKTRALKGKLTTEIISDLKAVHGLDAEQEIANILQTEITAEIDREIVTRIYTEAKTGAGNCSVAGTFDFSVDADGRWSMEKVMGLLIQIEREATWIAQETRRGRGNFILTSPELAAYLSMANLISVDIKNTGFDQPINPVGVSYYGMLTNRFKVYVDPYLTSTVDSGKIKHQMVVGYKGANVYDAGLFYCPYIPLQFFKATGEEDFGLRLGVKSRYGLVSNPFYMATGTTAATAATNSYYRKFAVITDKYA